MLALALFLLAAADARDPGQGRASVDCQVLADGRVKDCRLVSEDPTGANVGSFALQLARNTRVAPDDRRIRSGRIVLTFRMKLP
jgi:TonB family protein